MKILRIFLITWITNGVLLPFYGLNTVSDISNTLYFMWIGLKEMSTPTLYAVMIYFLIKRVLGNRLISKKRGTVIAIFVLFLIFFLSQLTFSYLIRSGEGNFWDSLGFWSFYLPWTLLASIMIPLLDRYYSRREEKAAQENVQ